MGLHKVIGLFAVGLLALLTFSCSEEQDQTVDQQYLESQEYNSFKQDTEKEISGRVGNEDLGQQLSALSSCESVTQMGLPITLGWEDLQERTDSSCQLDQENRRIFYIGEQRSSTYALRWFLIEHQSAYRDAEVIVATFDGDQLRSFRTVGVFEKIPAREVNSVISVTEKNGALHIQSETKRNIKYPLDQENSITTEYSIDEKGGISEL